MSDDTKAVDQAEFHKKAVKLITRARHKFVMTLAQQNKSRSEIISLLDLIDWNQEIEWATEDLVEQEEAKLKAAAQPPPRPRVGPQAVAIANRVEIPPDEGASHAVDGQAGTLSGEQQQPA
jgi:hypothetical protein